MAPSMIVRCPRDDDDGVTDCGVLCSDGRSLPELSTGLKNMLDSFGTLKSNQPENFGQRTPPRCGPCSGRNDPTQGNVACKNVRLAAIGGYLSRHQGSSLLADIFVQCRARVQQSQPVSRLSGFCSKAFLAFLFPCAAPPAVKCTNGIPRMRGPAMTRRRRA
jgi:hypothetical protein